ncbi:WxL domain-containing protein [Enterococcus sp. AZ196]|uniref:WxL domain-containing protein n=1 Tax=Enterococcus sp. AZ196 TaxID=2774659 RepID=UPI003D2B079F
MKHKISSLFFSLILVLNVLLPFGSAVAAESDPAVIDPQVQLLVDGGSNVSLDVKTEQLSLEIHYTPVELDQQERQKDRLQLELPKGISYSEEKNQHAKEAIIVDEQTKVLELDLQKLNSVNLMLDIDFDTLSNQTSIEGTHAVNDQVIGKTEALQIEKEVVTEADEAATEDTKEEAPSAVEEDKEVDAASEAEEEKPSEKRTTRAALDLGIPTTRTLPVAQLTDGQFDNVSYFDVGSRAEWDAALSVGVSATNAGNNNNKTEITYINLTDSFKMTDKTSGASTADIRTNRSDKKLVVNGNNQTIDFRDITFYFNSSDWDVVFQNVTVYNGNDWGVADMWNPGQKTIVTVHNYTQYGAQAFEGARGKLILSGDTSLESSPTESYISPIDGNDITIDKRYTGGSANVAVGEIYVKAGSNIMVDNGRLGANFVFYPKGNFYAEDGAGTKITLSNLKTPTKTGPWSTNDYAPGSISLVSNLASSTNTWPSNYRPASLIGREDSIYFGDNTEVEIHNGAPRRDHATVLQVERAGGTIELGENASFTGMVDETTAPSGEDETPIYFSSSGSIRLGKNAAFDLKIGETNDPSKAVGDAISFAGGANLELAEGSMFKLQSASGNADGLLKMTTAGSAINIADQATFDIGFTRPSNDPLFSLNGTLSIPATNGYVHRIRLWDNGEFDEATPSNSFHPLDNTKITYSRTTLGSKTTSLAVGFVDNGTVSEFNTKYTSNAQRLIVDPVVFDVKTIDDLTNEAKTEYRVVGTAEPPGGKVEVSGGPLDFLPADQRQVVVQADGSYEWKGNLSRPFYWGETIKASYVGHPDKYFKTVVADVTKPTGKGRTIHVVEGDEIPPVKDFIANVEDTNALETDKDKFGYTYVGNGIASGGTAAITNGQDMQEYTEQVIVDDTRGNDSDPVDVKLVVHKADTIDTILANDLTVRWSDVSGFTVGSTNYADYLKRVMGAKAQTIIDGDLIDLEVEVDNSASIPNTAGGPYVVSFVVRATGANKLPSDLKKNVNLTIILNLVEPRDPSVSDPSDKENEGTGAHGELRLDYVPSAFDIGTKEVQWKDTEYQAQGTSDQWVQVADERPAMSGWTLKAAATSFVSGADQLNGATLILPSGDMYNKKTAAAMNPSGLSSNGEVALTSTPSSVFKGDGENSKDESTYVWKKNQVKLKVPKGQGKAGKTYQSTITWTVEAGVTN